MKTTRWTKKDLRTLTSQIDTWMLLNRPLGSHNGGDFAAAVRDALTPEARACIVINGLTAGLSREQERAQSDADTAKHFAAHPGIYRDSTPEMIARFEGLAEESRKAARYIATLIARVEREPLPAEVLAYDPCARR